MAEHQDDRDHDEKCGNDLGKSFRFQPRGPSRSEPSAKQASSKQICNDYPVVGNGAEGNGTSSERQGRRDHNEAHGFVQDHSFQGGEVKDADEKRQPEFRAAEPYQAPESANDCAPGKGGGTAAAG